MTRGMPWPLAYGAFVVALAMVAWLTFLVLRFFEHRRKKSLVKSRVKPSGDQARTALRGHL
jgi:magnesium transporter